MPDSLASRTDLAGLAARIDHLITLGVPELAGTTDDEFRALGARLDGDHDGILVVHPALVPASRLTPLLRHGGKPGFVVEDMTDLDAFTPIRAVEVPDSPLYVIEDVARGDELANWSPEEALPEIVSRGRRPLTISEGISWLLQQPEMLVPNHCFMTIASRKPRGSGLDSRTPAIWISGGTGRDGRTRRGAPKVGWCWARNRHTWLGFASTTG